MARTTVAVSVRLPAPIVQRMEALASAQKRTLNRWLVEALTREMLAQVEAGERQENAKTVAAEAAAMRKEASEREARLVELVSSISERLRQLAGATESAEPARVDWRKVVEEGNRRFGISTR